MWGERGREGGFRLRPGWTTELTGLTESETRALMLAGMPGPATELGLGEAAISARLKLLASVPAPLRQGASLVAERLHIDPIDWYRTPDSATFLRETADAVWHNKRIKVTSASRFESGLRPIEAQVLVSPRAMGWLVHSRSRFVPWPDAHARQAASDGWQCVSLPIESIEHGARQMLGYGAEVEVVSPPELREAVAGLAGQVLARYERVSAREARASPGPGFSTTLP